MRLASIAAVLTLSVASSAWAAGNVTVDVAGDSVTIDGDDAANGILMTAGPAADAILIVGLDGTTVNGLPDETVAGVRRLTVRTGDGPDRVEIRQLQMSGRIHVRLGNGDDVFVAEQTTVNRLDVRGGRGIDTVTVGPQVRVSGLLHVRTGSDPDGVFIEGSELGKVVVGTDQGDDVLTLFDTHVQRQTMLFGNRGQDLFALAVSRFTGDVDLNLGDDDDVLRLDTVFFDANADLDGGGDDDFLVIDGPVDVDDSLRVNGF